MSDDAPEVEVTDVIDSTRYEAKIGGKLAGFTEYERRDLVDREMLATYDEDDDEDDVETDAGRVD